MNELKKQGAFEEWAFTITGILVGFLLVGPEILYDQFQINIMGGSLRDVNIAIGEGWTLSELRALSPLLFLFTVVIVYIREVVMVRRTGGYSGSMFTHTFETVLEDAVYMTITMMMLYSSILLNTMYASWLAGPITWFLFIFLHPLLKKKKSAYEEWHMPWLFITPAPNGR